MFSLSQLQRIREDRGLTQEGLSTLAEVPLSTIQKHERGAKADAYISVAAKLAVALNVPVEALYSAEIADRFLKHGSAA